MSAIKLLIKPAIVNMYTCYDKTIGYGLPFNATDDKMALQAFKYYCVADEEGKMKAPYLELYKCGTFNKDTGEYKNIKMKLLGKGKKYAVSNSIQREKENSTANRQ